jgi:hypothetical protein
METAVVTDARGVLPDFVLGQPLEPVPIPLGAAPTEGARVGLLVICAVTVGALWYTFGRRPR